MIKTCSKTTEKRLQIDISVVREAYEIFDISRVGFVRSHNNPADLLTKLHYTDALFGVLNQR